MWILPKQLHTSAYVLDTKELGLDSEAFSQTCERSLTWRGKDSLSRTWLQRWKRENWMQHLCSRTLRPSHTESFVDAWTSSLEDSRVSHSQLLESVKLLKTPDTSSPTSQTESESVNLELFSSKTFKESSVARQPTENQFSSMSSESWKDWVIEQRQEYSQRKKLAHLIRESESTSLAWPTASVAGCVEGGVAKNVEMTSSGFKATRENGTSYGAKLRDAVETYEKKNWATPRASATDSTRPNGKGGIPLADQVKNWATPQTFDSNNLVRTPEKLAQTRAEKNAGCMNLREQVHYPDMDHSRKGAKALSGHPDRANPSTNGRSQESWPTPRANKVHPQITEENREHLANRKKSNLEEDIAGHCGKATGKLNPNWVEHLMGLPVGWTQLPTEWIDSDC